MGELPIPPEEMRALVGVPDPMAFDNPEGNLVSGTEEATGDILDFGCGCGRLARQLIRQIPRPSSYIGVDLHAGMIRWCNQHLSPIAPQFRFIHHDVYNAGFNPDPSKPRHAELPADSGTRDLVIAYSVFTHILESSAIHYLAECARVLRPGGVLASTWFLFDKREFPMMQSFQNALYINTTDPTNAVIFDREWLRRACNSIGFELGECKAPALRGFHWVLHLRRSAHPKPLELPIDRAPYGSSPPPVLACDPASIGLRS